ncbi:MAG: A/G-specific adenine glycosylase [Bacteroidales bacterium]
MNFSYRLLQWYNKNKRDLPWRNSSNPYNIWLSEIILQQTRIAQGIEYYYRFLEKYPDIHSLAAATEDEILLLWQGLGYYSRARNMHAAAKKIVKVNNGDFPNDYQEILKLPGVGPYTAAAVSSIAFNTPAAAVDGNVIRVLARFFGIEDPVDDTKTTRQIHEIASELIDQQNPGMFNQALMDLGAMVCKPGKPTCEICPLANDCFARKTGLERSLPVKKQRKKQKDRYLHFFVLIAKKKDSKVFPIEKRTHNDIWKNLYQFPLLETPGLELAPGHLENHPVFNNLDNSNFINPTNTLIYRFTHLLTHQRIHAFFRIITLPEDYYHNFEHEAEWVTFDEFLQKGKPVLISRFLEKAKDLLD